MAKKSTRKSTVDPAGEKPEAETKAPDEARAEASPQAGTPKAEAEQVAAKAADAPVDEPATAASGGDAAAPAKPESAAKAERPGLSGIPVPAALMAAAIANRRRLAKWLNSRAAMVAIAAGLGAVVGSVVSSGLGQAIAIVSNGGSSERALRTSIGQLTAEVASLRARIAGNDKPSATVLSGTPQLLGAEIADAAGHAGTDPALVSPEITGSIEPSPPIAEGWTLWRVRNGRALVQGGSGYFEVAPGSRLPGLGLVETITRHGDGWAVETQSGLILPRS